MGRKPLTSNLAKIESAIAEGRLNRDGISVENQTSLLSKSLKTNNLYHCVL